MHEINSHKSMVNIFIEDHNYNKKIKNYIDIDINKNEINLNIFPLYAYIEKAIFLS